MKAKPLYFSILRKRNLLFRYPRCIHLSHHLMLPCWRGLIYDGYCAEHNNTCYFRCSAEIVKDHQFRNNEDSIERCVYAPGDTSCAQLAEHHVEVVGEWMQDANHLFVPSFPELRCRRCGKHWLHSWHIGSPRHRELYWRGWFFKWRERVVGRRHLMCWHLSHRLRLPCWRSMYSTHAMLCEQHYETCSEGCP